MAQHTDFLWHQRYHEELQGSKKPNLNFVCIFNISASIKTAKYASWGKTNLVRWHSQFRSKARNSRQGNQRTQSRVSQWYPGFENLTGSGGGALSTYTLEIKVNPNFLENHVKRYSEAELQQHIDKLHEYNEIKDVGQLLIGKLGKYKINYYNIDYFGIDMVKPIPATKC